MSRDMGSSWCTYSTYIVAEIKENDVRAHGHSMVTLR